MNNLLKGVAEIYSENDIVIEGRGGQESSYFPPRRPSGIFEKERPKNEVGLTADEVAATARSNQALRAFGQIHRALEDCLDKNSSLLTVLAEKADTPPLSREKIDKELAYLVSYRFTETERSRSRGDRPSPIQLGLLDPVGYGLLADELVSTNELPENVQDFISGQVYAVYCSQKAADLLRKGEVTEAAAVFNQGGAAPLGDKTCVSRYFLEERRALMVRAALHEVFMTGDPEKIVKKIIELSAFKEITEADLLAAGGESMRDEQFRQKLQNYLKKLLKLKHPGIVERLRRFVTGDSKNYDNVRELFALARLISASREKAA